MNIRGGIVMLLLRWRSTGAVPRGMDVDDVDG